MDYEVRGDQFRTTIICVDSSEEGIPQGRIYNQYIKGERVYKGLMQCVLKVEEIMDGMNFPQAYNSIREFAPRSKNSKSAWSTEYRPGDQATFELRIMFRQNSSWQGTITWVEGKQKQSFRSVLELIHLFSSALEYEAVS